MIKIDTGAGIINNDDDYDFIRWSICYANFGMKSTLIMRLSFMFYEAASNNVPIGWDIPVLDGTRC